MQKPQIAILLATCNGAKYLRPLLDSLFAQKEQSWQLLSSDDGSTDGTCAILEEYRLRYPRKVLLLKKERPSGSTQNNFMFLTRQAEGYPYLMYCDQDDVWLPEKITLTLQKMRETEAGAPDVPCLVHTDLAVTDASLRITDGSFFHSSGLDPRRCALRQLLIQNMVTGCTMMINAALRRLAAETADMEGMLMHDWWFSLLAAAQGRIGFEPTATILYRQHGGNVVGAKDARSLRYLARRAVHVRQNRQALWRSARQADALRTALGPRLSPGQQSLLADYGGLPGKSKPVRLYIVLRHGIWKAGWKLRLGEVIAI